MLWAKLVNLDKAVARFGGWSGHYTISAECGRPLPPMRRYCLLCRLIRRWLGERHCADAARDEGVMQ